MKYLTTPTQEFPSLHQANELERLEVLHSYNILDTSPEQAFSELAQLASFICGTPIALVSLVDEERQWFKARVGLDMQQTPREHGFCWHAMHVANVYEIPDTTLDARFADNPLTTGPLHIRFYAGAPLLSSEGLTLGMLCVLDTVPRRLNPDQREGLCVLARQVTAQLELRRMRLQLDDERQRMEGVLRMANNAGEELHPGNCDEIFVKQDQRLVRVATADLHYLEALGDYVNLYTTRERLTVYGTLRDLETKLPSRDFIRVHRKYIVRLDCISAIETDAAVLDSGLPTAINRTPVRVPIGSSYKAGLLARLNMI